MRIFKETSNNSIFLIKGNKPNVEKAKRKIAEIVKDLEVSIIYLFLILRIKHCMVQFLEKI